jgi:hypothetical protein
MNKPEGVENIRKEVVVDRPGSQLRPGKHATSSFSVLAWLQRFRQLDWPDRLNLILAAILGCALVLVLSPLFLVSWLCMQLARHGLAFRRPGHLGADRQA